MSISLFFSLPFAEVDSEASGLRDALQWDLQPDNVQAHYPWELSRLSPSPAARVPVTASRVVKKRKTSPRVLNRSPTSQQAVVEHAENAHQARQQLGEPIMDDPPEAGVLLVGQEQVSPKKRNRQSKVRCEPPERPPPDKSPFPCVTCRCRLTKNLGSHMASNPESGEVKFIRDHLENATDLKRQFETK
jgi:hypothetical protein